MNYKEERLINAIKRYIPRVVRESAGQILISYKEEFLVLKNRFGELEFEKNEFTTCGKIIRVSYNHELKNLVPSKILNNCVVVDVYALPVSAQSLLRELSNERYYGVESIEKEIIKMSAELFDKFQDLEQTHPSDINDIAEAVHDIQKVIAVRMARRAKPDLFINKC